MTSEQFTYWLQGFIETANPESITPEQTKIIKDHLALVFNKVTPVYPIEQIWTPTTTTPYIPYDNQTIC